MLGVKTRVEIDRGIVFSSLAQSQHNLGVTRPDTFDIDRTTRIFGDCLKLNPQSFILDQNFVAGSNLETLIQIY